MYDSKAYLDREQGMDRLKKENKTVGTESSCDVTTLIWLVAVRAHNTGRRDAGQKSPRSQVRGQRSERDRGRLCWESEQHLI